MKTLLLGLVVSLSLLFAHPIQAGKQAEGFSGIKFITHYKTTVGQTVEDIIELFGQPSETISRECEVQLTVNGKEVGTVLGDQLNYVHRADDSNVAKRMICTLDNVSVAEQIVVANTEGSLLSIYVQRHEDTELAAMITLQAEGLEKLLETNDSPEFKM